MFLDVKLQKQYIKSKMTKKKKSTIGGVTFFDTAQSNFPKIKLTEKLDATTPRNNKFGSTLGGFFQDHVKNSSLDILDLDKESSS